MTKYYRVRTPEQWDWLKNKLEIEDDLHVSNFPVTILYGDVICGIYRYHDDPEPLIEVSQLMGDEKMKDYVTIYNDDLDKITDELGICAFERITNSDHWVMVTADIRQLNIPKSLVQQHEEIDAYQEVAKNYPLSADDVRDILYHHVVSGSTLKVKMAKAEKAEFDELKEKYSEKTLSEILKYMDEAQTGKGLDEHLFCGTLEEDDQAQLDFARAWADPSLIEVIPEKRWNVKIPPFGRTNKFYYKYGGELEGADSVGNDDEDQQFTDSELKEYGLDDDMFEKIEVTDDGTK